ncbi:MAG: DUF1926 domain-containing protein [Spirochaetales bacterium]|nr:DUF1926 domain-containing protein [Spirochaetales bacterium]
MRHVRLVFGTYNILPQGESPDVYERLYQGALKPFLSLLNNYPKIPVVLHYCGSLYTWLEDSHPEFLMLLKEMTKRRQVELLGGGFYAPILSILPDGDKLGQIEKLTTYLRTTFGGRPRGAWIPERVWEPGLTRILANSGIEYAFLDDRHLVMSGLEESECLFPYLTEEQGKMVTILPLRTAMAHSIPAYNPDSLVLELNELGADARDPVVALMVPGARLGFEEGTGEMCYGTKGEGGWLRSFFQLLERNRDWLRLVTPRWSPETLAVQGRVYLPCVASDELMRSVLSPDRQKVFTDIGKRMRRQEAEQYLRGGFFRMFLTKYPEIDQLYCRFMYARLQVGQIRGDKYRKMAALDELWKGQTGAIYWHGTQDGAYASHLRKAAYGSFIEAERIARGVGNHVPGIIETDFDLDGSSEYLYQGKLYNAFVHSRGGSIFELDYVPAAWNYLDTFARWPEPYHHYRYEGCDWYPRRGFIDHFFPPGADLERFDRMTIPELGDFVGGRYRLKELRRDQRELVLEREGTLKVKKKQQPLRLQKRYRFRENSLEVQIQVENSGPAAIAVNYGAEINLSLPQGVEVVGGCGEESRPVDLERSETGGLDGLVVRDPANEASLALSSSGLFDLWCLAVETVSYPPAGRTRSYQGTCFVPRWSWTLEPGQSQAVTLTLRIAAL